MKGEIKVDKEKKIVLGLWVTPELKQAVKEYCVKNKKTYEQFVIEALRKAMKK